MITVPTYEEPNRVTCVPGFERLLVCTLTDPATVVVVTINGVTYTSGSNLTLTARGVVCWTGVINLSAAGLVKNTRYGWTVTQGANSDSGSYFHTPAKGTDFKVLFAGCDNNNNFSNPAGAYPTTVPGFWQYYKTLYDTDVDIAGVLFPDDIGYIDNMSVLDGAGSAYGNNTGLDTTGNPGASTSTQADYYIAWCCWLGMLGPTGTYTNGVTGGAARWLDLEWLQLVWGRETNRAFCRKNINIFPQWGDHEFSNDMGWDKAPTKGAFAGNFTRGKLAWQAFLGLIQPPNTLITALDSTANHWVQKLGDLTLVAPDLITNATRADWTSGTGDEDAIPPNSTDTPTPFQTLFGSNQITDINAAIATAANPFCLFGMGNSPRYAAPRVLTNGIYEIAAISAPSWGGVTEYYHAAQHPIFDHCRAEWQALVTSSSTGLMANGYFNGRYGIGAWLHSDLHFKFVLKNVHPAYAGNVAENFYSIYHGATNGSAHFDEQTYGAESIGQTIGSSTYIEYAETDNTESDRHFGGVIVSIHGSSYPKTMHIDLLDNENRTVWDKTFEPERQYLKVSINPDKSGRSHR